MLRKKLGKGILMLGIIAMFSATGVAAAGNSVTTFYFSANGTPQISNEKNTKAKDNDYKAYVTTSAGMGGVTSTAFQRGATVYARTRLNSDKNGVYSPLFTFVRNEKQSKTYASGMAKFGQVYVLKAETDNAYYSTDAYLTQIMVWCP